MEEKADAQPEGESAPSPYQRIAARLAELRTTHARGARQLAELERQAEAVRETLAQVTGAISVLEEWEGGG